MTEPRLVAGTIRGFRLWKIGPQGLTPINHWRAWDSHGGWQRYVCLKQLAAQAVVDQWWAAVQRRQINSRASLSDVQRLYGMSFPQTYADQVRHHSFYTCKCGFYATSRLAVLAMQIGHRSRRIQVRDGRFYDAREGVWDNMGSEYTLGVIEGKGQVAVAERGFRATEARIVALVNNPYVPLTLHQEVQVFPTFSAMAEAFPPTAREVENCCPTCGGETIEPQEGVTLIHSAVVARPPKQVRCICRSSYVFQPTGLTPEEQWIRLLEWGG
jgi:hypothetical protein